LSFTKTHAPAIRYYSLGHQMKSKEQPHKLQKRLKPQKLKKAITLLSGLAYQGQYHCIKNKKIRKQSILLSTTVQI